MTLLLALALLVQQKSAEETFKSIERKIEAARTISLRFKVETLASEGKLAGSSEMSGPLMIKDPRKLNLEYKGSIYDGNQSLERTARFVTDGERVLAEIAGERRPLATSIKSGFKPLISRCGVKIGWGVLIISRSDPTGKPKPVDLDLAGRFTVLDFRHGEDDGAYKTLTYTLRRNVGAEQVNVSMRISYDPKTLLLAKRSFVEPNKSRTSETYTDLKLNADIGDESFAVPETK